MNTQGECVLPQCVLTAQGSLEGEEELQREEYGNMQTDKVTHMDSCMHIHISHGPLTCCFPQGQGGLRGGLSL